jgi:UDP-glucose 4-epimerase
VKILVTGSKGFIGSHLLKHFDSRFSKRNVICIPHEELYSIKFLKSLPEPDIIYHFASYGNMATQTDPQETVRANVTALNNLLFALQDVPFKAFINASSSSVYGEKNHPMHETNSLEATDYYGVTKIMGELLVRAYVNRFDKPVVNARFFSVYGPGEAPFRFIPTVIRCIKGEEMSLAPGMHDWIDIRDAIDALFLLEEHAQELKGKSINIGTGVQYDNYDVVRKLCDIAKVDIKKLPIHHVASMRSRNCWVADNTLLRSLVWIPKVSLQEGLTNVWNTK